MGKMTGNCTDTKADITVRAVFDGNQSGQQAFMRLIRKKYSMGSTEAQSKNVDKSEYCIDKTQHESYTKGSEADVGGTTVGFAENGGQHDEF